jgi:predicted GIY-YIG superfamily endonuclease
MEEINMRWSSRWKNVDKPLGYLSHAVYEIRLVNGQGHAVTINRFLNTDKKGILCIGMATNMENRRKQFNSGEQGRRRHSEGNLLFLLKEYSHFEAKHGNSKYEYHFKKLNTKDDATKKETKLIKDYVKQYGEVPPLNSAIPNRYDQITWDDRKNLFDE